MVQLDIHLKIFARQISDGMYLIWPYPRVYDLLKFWGGPWIPHGENKIVVTKDFGYEINGPIRSIAYEIDMLKCSNINALSIWGRKCISDTEKELHLQVYQYLIYGLEIGLQAEDIDLAWKVED